MSDDQKIVLIAHNLRSCHNVGSLLRTAEGLGVAKVILSGYTPYPLCTNDERLPHLAQKLHRQIRKTALGAEELVAWKYTKDVFAVVDKLRQEGYKVLALEQTPGAFRLPDFEPPTKLALIVGREVEGLEPEVVAICDQPIEIPMYGQKESFNVVQAAAMALYHCTFM
jgi:23S rRNA (guanosine2251-2'-O)-methyltransferase